MYVTDQPAFLNGVVEIATDFNPESMLQRAKLVENELGRNFSEVRNGPRPIDLDILFYEHLENESYKPIIVSTPALSVPHPRIAERDFVLAPLRDVAGEGFEHPSMDISVGDMLDKLYKRKGDSSEPDPVRVIPLPRQRMLFFNETVVMGILNVTPDSFSDGGKWISSVENSVERALEMEHQGARIIDIGGESTRPGAPEVPVDIQIQRTVPVIKKIREVSDIPISIDTRHADVAEAAILAGADIVNDVSGGQFDENMLGTVAKLGVPVILMHMRGTPESMQDFTNYADVVEEVTGVLRERSVAAEVAGIPRWLQILDPGIGFAKDLHGNLSLLKQLNAIRRKLGNMPILLGTSRKGFIRQVTGEPNAEDRDYATVGSKVTALCIDGSPEDCNIIRVHNVKASRDASLVMDAIRNAK
eukprot:Nitzschia sp. Nitz4//scaffold260_size33533//28720//29970//NITZ4_007883-RA/size33533-processed-gene-0.9-mRNA-1//-1//CDS//3329544695//604//frame0